MHLFVGQRQQQEELSISLLPSRVARESLIKVCLVKAEAEEEEIIISVPLPYFHSNQILNKYSNFALSHFHLCVASLSSLSFFKRNLFPHCHCTLLLFFLSIERINNELFELQKHKVVITNGKKRKINSSSMYRTKCFLIFSSGLEI